MINNKEQRALKPDAQAFDEIRIFVVPRYKTSGMSGDEWRISTTTEFHRKGKKVHEVHHGKMEAAAACLGYDYLSAVDNGKGFFAGEENICDQEGCHEPATVTLRVIKEFSRDNPHEWNKEIQDRILVRKFCGRHSTRGDCAFDDADQNYQVIKGETKIPNPDDVKPSQFGGVIDAKDLGLQT